MRSKRRTAVLLPACCALALGACGNNGPATGADETPAQTQRKSPAAGSEMCRDVEVPGHKAVDVQATGTECAPAEGIAAAAEGRGRSPYESGGFACEPSDASGGDTNYSCSMGDAKVTFLYGTA